MPLSSWLLAEGGLVLVQAVPAQRLSRCLQCRTRADIMRFLLARLGELGGVADRTIEQLGMLTGEGGSLACLAAGAP